MSVPREWTPSAETIAQTRLQTFIESNGKTFGFNDVISLHRWSVEQPAHFWSAVISTLPIQFSKPYETVLDESRGSDQPIWCKGAKLNIALSCFQDLNGDAPAIVEANESDWTKGNRSIKVWTYQELWQRSRHWAASIQAHGYKPGDALAVDVSMHGESVALYLGIILAGCVAVSIADSFAVHEIVTRLEITKTKAIFTQDAIDRAGKRIPLYAKVKEACEALDHLRAIVLRDQHLEGVPLRSVDQTLKQFLGKVGPAEIAAFEPEVAEPDAATGYLFSSGTTGEPKVIPWTHLTPIKCAMDGLFHQNIGSQTVVAWPTNLGWMMGPWLIYASLINRGTIALFDGAPHGRAFGEFVAKAKVQVLGVIPSLVKVWRNTACMEGLDWSAIQCFSSTGECSNELDMGYLMDLAGGKPVIEYCGGTEIGGAYITGTMVQTQKASMFSMPAMGVDIELLPSESDVSGRVGEVAIIGPSIGLSTSLLNKDHHEVYFAGMPKGKTGKVLRRHGDQLERLPGGFFRALGRVDDTMNLGGIKVSSAEIERVLNLVPGVLETAAIAVNPSGGGPSQLVVYAVEKTEGARPQIAAMQKCLSRELNPLFKIEDVVWVSALPRTASNKIMRRVLRDRYTSTRNA